jgi:DNA-binding MarR family transcriptional regulator
MVKVAMPLETIQKLLAILPLLNRIVATEVRNEIGEETTMAQFRVLALLDERPLTLSALAKERRVSLQSMSELVQGLVVRNLIERFQNPSDRRQSLLNLTESGRTHYKQIEEQIMKRLKPAIEELSPEELTAIHLALPALYRVLIQEEDYGDSERSPT